MNRLEAEDILSNFELMVQAAESVPVDAQRAMARFGLSSAKYAKGARLLAALVARPDLDSEVEDLVLGSSPPAQVVVAWLSRPGLDDGRVERMAAAESRKTVLRELAGIPGLPDPVYVRACERSGLLAASRMLGHVPLDSPVRRVALKTLMSSPWESLPGDVVPFVSSKLVTNPELAVEFLGPDTSPKATFVLLGTVMSGEVPLEVWSALSAQMREDGRRLFDRLAVELERPLEGRAVSMATFSPMERSLQSDLSAWLRTVEYFTQSGVLPSPSDLSEWHDLLGAAAETLQVAVDHRVWRKLSFAGSRSLAQWAQSGLVGLLDGAEDRQAAYMSARERMRDIVSLADAQAALQVVSPPAERHLWRVFVRVRIVELLADPAQAALAEKYLALVPEVSGRSVFSVGVGLVRNGHWESACHLARWLTGSFLWSDYVEMLVKANPSETLDLFAVLDMDRAARLGGVWFGQAVVKFAALTGVPVAPLVWQLPVSSLPAVLNAPEAAGPVASELFGSVTGEKVWDVLAQLWPNMPSTSLAGVLETAQRLA